MMDFYTNVKIYGDKVYARGYKNGKRVSLSEQYAPTLYTRNNKPHERFPYRNVAGDELRPIKFEGIKKARNFVYKYNDTEGMNLYGMSNFEYAWIKDKFPKDIEYDEKLIRVATIDIEVECEHGFPEPALVPEPVNVISIHMNGKTYALGTGDCELEDYTKCKDEYELLEMFLDLWEALDPDIVTGWSVRFFDIPYLYNRIKKLFNEPQARRMSPWKIVRSDTFQFKNREQTTFDLFGITILDLLELYRKYGTMSDMESYALNHVAHVELGERKIDYSKEGNLRMLYQQNFHKFVEYNIQDTMLVVKLDNKKKLISLAIFIAYICRINYIDCFKQTRMWDSLIYNHLAKDNIMIPHKKPTKKDEPYPGAFVKQPDAGLYEWVMSFDLTSLYPHLIMQYNIGPDTFIEGKHENFSIDDIIDGRVKNETEYSMAGNGFFFDKSRKSFLAELMEKMYIDRAATKKEMIAEKKLYEKTRDKKHEDRAKMLDVKQNALKTTLNSAYGSIGNEYFRWFDVRQASAITLGGQLSIRWIEKYVNRLMNSYMQTENIDYIIAVDTDSIYVSCKDIIKRFEQDSKAVNNHGNQPENKVKYDSQAKVDYLDKLAKDTVEPFMTKAYEKLAEVMGAYDQKMFMKREVIADRGIWTRKKRYVLNVLDSEGVRFKRSELKIMGLEAVRSSTPESCRKRIKNSLRIILSKDEQALQHYVGLFRKKFYALPIEDIAFPRGISEINKSQVRDYAETKYEKMKTISGTPIHVKSAISYNNLLKKHDVEHIYDPIREGEKLKFAYLKQPNPTGYNAIAFQNYLPPEFELDEFIDREVQFEKAFLLPLTGVLEVIGWSAEPKASLAGLGI